MWPPSPVVYLFWIVVLDLALWAVLLRTGALAHVAGLLGLG
jgi:hypothetical protein